MGLSPKEIADRSTTRFESLVDELFTTSKDFAPIRTEHSTATQERYKAMKSPEQFKFRRASRDATHRLNALWRQRLITTEGCLREKMALFWHGHFASWSHWSISTEQYINMIRENSLGNFGTLLKAVSRSASMLEFLSNQRNVKDAPNENFAREVMELFTLGHGQYTEQDIHEAARAFTGWAFHLESAEFHFRENQHDFGEKTFRGKTGNFNGDDILDRILADKRTAVFITRKIHRWFVDPEIDEDFATLMADRFFASNYDIADLMRFVFMSDHFQDPARFGRKIKSPIELLCGIDKNFTVRFAVDADAILLQRMLGQILLYPPNVAGWKEGTAWIDSNSLMLRLKLPAALINQGTLDWDDPGDTPQDNDMMMSMGGGDAPMRVGKGRALRTLPDRDAFLAQLDPAITNDGLFALLLQVDASAALRGNVSNGTVLERVLEVLCSPEYQLC